MFRRIFAALLVVAALMSAATTTAVAVTTATMPATTGLCASAPEPEMSSETVSNAIDMGAPAPTTTGGGTYTQRGWGGFFTHLYDPGCLKRATEGITEKMGVGTGLGMAASAVTGQDRVASAVLSLLVFVGALMTLLIRFATGDGDLWAALDVGEAAARTFGGWFMFATWVALVCVGIGLWFMARASKSDLAETTSKNMTAVIILASGIFVAGWQAGPGPAVDDTIQATYRASGEVATGSPDAAAAFADFYADSVLVTAFGLIHFGPGPGMKYAARLHAAQSFTRAEESAALADPGEAARLAAAKKADYTTVANEIKASDKASFDRLSGKQMDKRVWWALLVLVIVALMLPVLAVCGAGVAASRVVTRFGFAVWPGVAVLTAHPMLQHWGVAAAKEFARWVWWGVLSIIGFVGFTRVLSAILTTPDEVPWLSRLIAAAVLSGCIIWAWKRRSKLAEKAHVQRQAAATETAARSARNVAVDSAQAVARQWKATDPKKQDATAGTTEGASPPQAPERPATGSTVHELVKSRREAREARNARVDPVAQPHKRVAASTSSQRIADATTRLSAARPTEAVLARRERAALMARTSSAPAVKKNLAATSTVTRRNVNTIAVRARKARLAKTAVNVGVTAAAPTKAPANAMRRAAASLIRRK